MKKILIVTLAALVLSLTAVTTAFASPDTKGTAKAPGVARPPESELSKVVFIHYAPGREPVCDNNSVCAGKENSKNCPSDCPVQGDNALKPPAKPSPCYAFLSKTKPHWNLIENYSVDNATLATSAAKATGVWNDATSATIFGSAIAGAGEWGVYDSKNSIVYGNYSNPDVIGITAIWYRRDTIYEYDIMFDSDYFPGDGSVDLNSVVLHEFGHGAGLDDLYKSTCSTEVMYGYYTGVDIDLGTSDKAGIKILYGN